MTLFAIGGTYGIVGVMNDTEPTQTGPVTARPPGRPDRMVLLRQMLEGTKRAGVPIRTAFIQKPRSAGDERGNMLKSLSRSERTLDAYLLLHAMCSASEPYDTKWPIETWVQMGRFDEAAKGRSTEAAWQRSVRSLKELKLIGSKRRRNMVDYYLLDESGNGLPYKRPKTEADGTWFTLPYTYWTNEWDKRLTSSEKRMLLVALAQPEWFVLPANRAPLWYGVSETSAQEGLSGLFKHALLDSSVTWEASAKSPTGWRQVNHYTLVTDFSRGRRASAIERVAFADTKPEPAEEAVGV